VNKATTFPSLINELVADFGNPALFWQLALLAGCIAFAAWRARVVLAAWNERSTNGESNQTWSEFRSDALARLLFPLFALLTVMVAKALSGIWLKTTLLSVAIACLMALALVRIIVYAVSRLTRSAAVAGFERLLVLFVWLSLILYVSGHWIEVVDVLEQTTLTLGKQTISLWMLVTGVFWTVLTAFVSVWLGGFIESRLLANQGIDTSLSAVLGRLIRALLLVAGLLIGLTLVGLDLTALSVFGGALGVGIGLGLQRIASNYISGFIVLFERMVRIGDVIKVDQFSGQVKEIRTRFTVLRSGDGVDQIVPNELLTAQTVLNSTTSGTAVLKLPFTLAPSADFDLAGRIALEVIAADERVLKEPAPGLFFRGWTPEGLVLELIFTVTDPNKVSDRVRSDAHRELWRRLQQAQVPVPFLQRDYQPGAERMATFTGPGATSAESPLSGSAGNR
jgi:small-conductance mechanosensitive channel